MWGEAAAVVPQSVLVEHVAALRFGAEACFILAANKLMHATSFYIAFLLKTGTGCRLHRSNASNEIVRIWLAF